jgi:homoserine kinase
MVKKEIRVFAPATVANVTCGFDIFGFAIDSVGDEVVLRLCDKPGITIKKITGDEGKLPLGPDKNTAGVAIKAFLESTNSHQGVEIDLHKGMPLGSGLGSSAASAVAAVFGANFLFGNLLKREELLKFALEGERIASGEAHADNIAPSLLGGFVVVRSYDPLDIIKIPVPNNLFTTIAHPWIEIRTEDARKILKESIPLKDAVTQWGNVAGFVAGLMKEDYDLIARSMQDVIVEPVRSSLIPGFKKVKESALKAGALGCGISGSGPSIFALSTSEEAARNIGKSMQSEFEGLNIKSDLYISRINKEGAKILS